MEYPWATSLKIDCPVVDTKPGFHPVEYGTAVYAEIDCLLPKGAESVGEIRLEKILIRDARRYGVAVRDVVVERGLEVLFPLIFTDEEEVKVELDVAPGWVDLQVITDMTVDAQYRTESVVVRSVQSLISFLGAKDLVVVLLSNSQSAGVYLTHEELKLLGFERIAGTNAAIRDPAIVSLNAIPMM